jgi:PST family polysaccharide transporter
MANDYFPRLSAIVNDNELVEDTIHNQIILILTIIGPMIATMTISCGFIIKLLYSDDFQGINNIVLWMTFSYIFKAISWTIGFLIIAKGLGKHFLWNELISNSYMLLIQIISFKYFYLDGLAKGYLIGTVLHLIQILLYSRYYLNIKIKVEVFIVAFLFLVLNILLVYSLQHYLNKEISVITASIVFVSIFAFSFIKLRDYFTHR